MTPFCTCIPMKSVIKLSGILRALRWNTNINNGGSNLDCPDICFGSKIVNTLVTLLCCSAVVPSGPCLQKPVGEKLSYKSSAGSVQQRVLLFSLAQQASKCQRLLKMENEWFIKMENWRRPVNKTVQLPSYSFLSPLKRGVFLGKHVLTLKQIFGLKVGKILFYSKAMPIAYHECNCTYQMLA